MDTMDDAMDISSSPEPEEHHPVLRQILRYLIKTRYKCEYLPWPGRAKHLEIPFQLERDFLEPFVLEDGSGEFITKCILRAVQPNQALHEASWMTVLAQLMTFKMPGGPNVRVPKIYFCDPAAGILLHETCPFKFSHWARGLKRLLGHDKAHACAMLGGALGRWLRDFHNLTNVGPQNKIAQKESIRPPRTNLPITYTEEGLKRILDPGLSSGRMPRQVQIRARFWIRHAVDEVDLRLRQRQLDIIHGNYSLDSLLFDFHGNLQLSTILITDWGDCGYGLHEWDLGTMIGELCVQSQTLLEKEDVALIVNAMVGEYGPVSDTFAKRVTRHVGLYLMKYADPAFCVDEDSNTMFNDGLELFIWYTTNSPPPWIWKNRAPDAGS